MLPQPLCLKTRTFHDWWGEPILLIHQQQSATYILKHVAQITNNYKFCSMFMKSAKWWNVELQQPGSCTSAACISASIHECLNWTIAGGDARPPQTQEWVVMQCLHAPLWSFGWSWQCLVYSGSSRYTKISETTLWQNHLSINITSIQLYWQDRGH